MENCVKKTNQNPVFILKIIPVIIVAIIITTGLSIYDQRNITVSEIPQTVTPETKIWIKAESSSMIEATDTDLLKTNIKLSGNNIKNIGPNFRLIQKGLWGEKYIESVILAPGDKIILNGEKSIWITNAKLNTQNIFPINVNDYKYGTWLNGGKYYFSFDHQRPEYIPLTYPV